MVGAHSLSYFESACPLSLSSRSSHSTHIRPRILTVRKSLFDIPTASELFKPYFSGLTVLLERLLPHIFDGRTRLNQAIDCTTRLIRPATFCFSNSTVLRPRLPRPEEAAVSQRVCAIITT